MIVFAHSCHERGVRDADEHETLTQESNASEHLLRGVVPLALKCRADPLGESFVVLHVVLRGLTTKLSSARQRVRVERNVRHEQPERLASRPARRIRD